MVTASNCIGGGALALRIRNKAKELIVLIPSSGLSDEAGNREGFPENLLVVLQLDKFDIGFGGGRWRGLGA